MKHLTQFYTTDAETSSGTTSAVTFEVSGNIEYRTSPLIDEFASSLLVFLGLLGMLVEIHDGLPYARRFQCLLSYPWKLKYLLHFNKKHQQLPINRIYYNYNNAQ